MKASTTRLRRRIGRGREGVRGSRRQSQPEPRIDLGPLITLVECHVNRTSVQPTEGVPIGYTVENQGDAAGDYTIEFRIGGTTVAVDEPSSPVSPGDPRNATASFVPVDEGVPTGTHTIEALDPLSQNWLTCGQITVEGDGGGNGGGGIDPGAINLISSCGVQQSTVQQGETVEVAFDVTNSGDAAGDWAVGAEVNGQMVDISDSAFPLGPGATTGSSVFVNTTGFDPGLYEVALNIAPTADELTTIGTGFACGSFTVEQAGNGNGGNGGLGNVPLVQNCSLDRSTVGANETISASFDVTNVGDAAGPWAVGLEIDGSGGFVATTESGFDISPGEVAGSSVSFTPSAAGLGPGEHVLTIQWADVAGNLSTAGTGLACGQFAVEQPGNGNGGGNGDGNGGGNGGNGGGQPGGGDLPLPLLAIALVGAGLVIARR